MSIFARNNVNKMNEIQTIQSKIYEIRGQRVMLDRDLAELYQVTTGNLNKAVKRNIRRFPPDFMFQLTKDEFNRLKSDLIFQNGTSNWGGTRKLPYAFTEQGLAMLSGVLTSGNVWHDCQAMARGQSRTERQHPRLCHYQRTHLPLEHGKYQRCTHQRRSATRRTTRKA